MKLWVDDIRPAPEGWTLVSSFRDAVNAFRIYGDAIEVISLDHDLGAELTGYDLAKYMVEYGIWPQDIYFHTANPVGQWNMYQLLSHYAPEGVTVHA